MAVPAMPGAALVMVEAKLILRGLEGIFDDPALPFDGDQGLDCGPGRTPGGEVGTLAIGKAAADQQATGPEAGGAGSGLLCLQVGQFEVSPVVEPRPLGALARGQALPGSRRETLRDRLGGPGDHRLADP